MSELSIPIYNSEKSFVYDPESVESRIFSIDSDETSDRTVDLFPVNAHLEDRNFTKVVNDSRLFWTAFCMVARKIRISGISFSLEGDSLTLSGTRKILRETEEAVDAIRPFFADGFRTYAPFEVVLRETTEGIYFVKISEEIIPAPPLPKIPTPSSLYNTTIKPALPEFAKLFGASYEEGTVDCCIESEAGIARVQSFPSFRVRPKEHLSSAHSSIFGDPNFIKV